MEQTPATPNSSSTGTPNGASVNDATAKSGRFARFAENLADSTERPGRFEPVRPPFKIGRGTNFVTRVLPVVLLVALVGGRVAAVLDEVCFFICFLMVS